MDRVNVKLADREARVEINGTSHTGADHFQVERTDQVKKLLRNRILLKVDTLNVVKGQPGDSDKTTGKTSGGKITGTSKITLDDKK